MSRNPADGRTLRAATPLMVALAPEKMGLTEEQAKTAMHANAAGVDEALWMKVLARERG